MPTPLDDARSRIIAELHHRRITTDWHTATVVADAVFAVFPVAFYIPGYTDPDTGTHQQRRYLALRANPEPGPAQ